jgi:hypothetical protein
VMAVAAWLDRNTACSESSCLDKRTRAEAELS